MRRSVFILLFISSWATAQVNFTSSTLPIVVIDTDSIAIPAEPKIHGLMGIIYNGPGQVNNISDSLNLYNGHIGIETRGSTSSMFPQQSYGLETRNPDSSNLNVSLFDWPSDNDFILHAPYTDKSLMRNVLTYKLGNELGRWAPRTQFCEVVLNGTYIGVYVMMERIKENPGRVHIDKLNFEDTLGNELTGGYIVKIDKTTGGGEIAWTSPYLSQAPGNNQIKFQVHEPDLNELHLLQKAYIQDYITDWEVALKISSFTSPINGYKAYIDVASFIDYFLITELSKNVDSYRISTFLHKQRISEGGKLVAGPLWDYNIAWGNADYCQGSLTSGWEINFNDYCGGEWQNPFWWKRLLEDPLYANDVKCRWTNLRQSVLSDTEILTYIDSMATLLTVPAQRHYQKWPILGAYIWPNNFIGQTFEEEINYLKTWIQNRTAWMDANMFGTCTASISDPNDQPIKLYPNPTSSVITASSLQHQGELLLIDVFGKIILTIPYHSHTIELNLQNLQAGIYFLSEPNKGIYEKVIKSD